MGTLVHQLPSECFTLLEASRGIKASLRTLSSVSTQRSLKMRPIWTSLALVLASLLYVQGYTCPPGKSKKTITLGVGESVDFSTQDADSYGKNVKCVVKFKKAKKAKCELNFSCSAFTLTAKNSNCNRGSDFLKIGKEKFCEDNSPDVTVAGRTLNVLFRSNKRSKGGEGAECEATCVDPDDETPTTVAPPATTRPPSPPVTTAAPTTGLSNIWRQPGFTTGQSPEENFAEWNAKISWGFKEGLVSIAGDWLEVLYPAGSTSPGKNPRGGVGIYASPVDLSGKRSVELGYNLRFGDGFDFVKGGKLPGLYGGHTSCSGGADSENCFSTRFMWRRSGDGEVYAYMPNDQVEGFCEEPDVHCNYEYGHSLGRGAWRFEVGVDQLLSQKVTLNTPGAMDGSVVVMLDGVEVYRREQLNIRNSAEVEVLGIMLFTFYGGSESSWAPSYDTQAYFRNFSLSV